MRVAKVVLVAALAAAGSGVALGRTAADAVTPIDRLGWDIWKQRYEEKVAEIKTGRHYDVVFVGDSITHYWERDCRESWERWLGKYNPLNLGILADATEHVLWRLTKGGQLDGYSPKAFVVLIGTNNVGNNPSGAEHPEWAAAGVKKILDTIKSKHAGAKILLLAILPRSRDNDIKCRYPQANDEINRLLRKFADDKTVFWLDCGRRFLSGRQKGGVPLVDTVLMSDSLHPTAKGYEILGEEITRRLDGLLKPEPGTMAIWPEGKMPSREAAQYIPEMIVTLPEKRTTDAFLIVAPGGSYEKHCVWEDERAIWFNHRGMATARLRYRVPRPKNGPKHLTAWQDAQRAVRIVRAHASEWGINPEKIGFLGHSAGGHLTVLAAVSSQTPAYEAVDAIDRLPCHVNFAIPCYPAYLLGDDGKIDPALKFDAKTPPMYFFHGAADGFSAGTRAVVERLRAMGKPVEYRSYPGLGHGALDYDDFIKTAWEWVAKFK